MLTPARIEVFNYTVGFVLKGVGALLGGLVGMALAMSFYYILNSVMLGAALRRRAVTQLQERNAIQGHSLLSGEIR